MIRGVRHVYNLYYGRRERFTTRKFVGVVEKVVYEKTGRRTRPPKRKVEKLFRGSFYTGEFRFRSGRRKRDYSKKTK